MSGTTKAIPVTGLGCVCAAGGTVAEMAETLFSGRRKMGFCQVGKSRYPVFELGADSAPPGYAEGPECERCGLLAVTAADQAFREAGLTKQQLQNLRVGVCIGTTAGVAMNSEGFYRDFRRGLMPDIKPIRQYLRANPASMVAEKYGLSGPLQTIANACSSGSVAVGQAAEWVASGMCDLAVAGGADSLCNIINVGFASLLITDSEPCRPFDRDRRGLNLGEGAGLVVLESEESVRRRGVQHVRARLCGYGNASDAYHISAPDPRGNGLKRALRKALFRAGLEPSDISFINAHGTGTPENDKVEGQVFPDMFPDVPFGSTKGMTGHSLGAAGGIEAVITILCLQQRRIPASVGFERPDPDFAGRPVRENTAITGEYGLSDSAAFGGNNAVLIFQGIER